MRTTNASDFSETKADADGSDYTDVTISGRLASMAADRPFVVAVACARPEAAWRVVQMADQEKPPFTVLLLIGHPHDPSSAGFAGAARHRNLLGLPW
jgi:hypothetical protein